MMNAPPSTQQIVHLVDDDDSLRGALARLLRLAGHGVREYPSAIAFLMAQEDMPRGCIILDVRMPGGPGGIELHQSLVRRGNSLPVIFLTGHGDIPMSVHAIKNGAFDFLMKPVRKDTLLDTVGQALKQEHEVWQRDDYVRGLRQRRSSLTQAETEVCRHVIAGDPNKKIADEVGCSERTVKSHRANVMMKMGAGSLAELVHMFDELGRVGWSRTD